MNKQKKQNILTAIIIILFIALIIMIGSIVYEEKMNMSKEPAQQVTSTPEKEEPEEVQEETPNPDETENNVETETPQEENNTTTDYVGEEENNSDDSTKSNQEKAIELVKKEWGNDDTVEFSIEQINGTKYYVAVKSPDEPTVWYEVDIETWEVSEY